jgi:hypothetical protein
MQQKVFRIVRDSRPIEQKLNEGFIYTERDITSANFSAAGPAAPRDADQAVLVNFGEYVFSEHVLSRLEQMGYRPGLPTELVDLSRSVPDSTELAGCLPLVALGDSWQGPLGNLLVVFLVGDAKSRGLSLHWRGGGWNDSYWFLAFRV